MPYNNTNNRMPPYLWYLAGYLMPLFGAFYKSSNTTIVTFALCYMAYGLSSMLFDTFTVNVENVEIENYHLLSLYQKLIMTNINYERFVDRTIDVEKGYSKHSEMYGLLTPPPLTSQLSRSNTNTPTQQKVHRATYNVSICTFGKEMQNIMHLIYFLGLTHKNFSVDNDISWKKKVNFS